MAMRTGVLKAVVGLLAVCLASYIVGPPLYWQLMEGFASTSASVSCPPCDCDCDSMALWSIPQELKEDLQALVLTNIKIKYKLKLVHDLQGNPSDLDEWRLMGNEKRIDRVKMYTECNIP